MLGVPDHDAAEWEGLAFDTFLQSGSSYELPVSVYCHGDHKPEIAVLYFGTGCDSGAGGISNDRIIRSLFDAGATVLSVEPAAIGDLPFPLSLDYSLGGLSELLKRAKKIIHKKPRIYVAGLERGGNLAAGLALKARDAFPGALAGQILFSPLLDAAMATQSMHGASGEQQQTWSSWWSRHLAGSSISYHPYAAPSYCTRLSGLPPTLMFSKAGEPLQDEIADFSDRLRVEGISLQEYALPGSTGPSPRCTQRRVTATDPDAVTGIAADFFASKRSH